jgi:hypothetical protein
MLSYLHSQLLTTNKVVIIPKMLEIVFDFVDNFNKPMRTQVVS